MKDLQDLRVPIMRRDRTVEGHKAFISTWERRISPISSSLAKYVLSCSIRLRRKVSVFMTSHFLGGKGGKSV